MVLSPPMLALGLAGNFLNVKPVSVSQRVKWAPDQHLWFRVGWSDADHHPTADAGRNDISQQGAFVPSKTGAFSSPSSA
jgi:hypothetical protein